MGEAFISRKVEDGMFLRWEVTLKTALACLERPPFMFGDGMVSGSGGCPEDCIVWRPLLVRPGVVVGVGVSGPR